MRIIPLYRGPAGILGKLNPGNYVFSGAPTPMTPRRLGVYGLILAGALGLNYKAKESWSKFWNTPLKTSSEYIEEAQFRYNSARDRSEEMRQLTYDVLEFRRDCRGTVDRTNRAVDEAFSAQENRFERDAVSAVVKTLQKERQALNSTADSVSTVTTTSLNRDIALSPEATK